jgi:predicted Zn-dependent protease
MVMKEKLVLLEEYLDDLLSEQEGILFEEILRNDPELMKEFLLRKDVNEALQESDIMGLRNTLDEISEYNNKTKSIYKNSFFITSAAACIVLIITFSWICFYSLPNVNNQHLFGDYYSKYPVVNHFRSNTAKSENDLLLNFAFDAYESNDYIKSSEYLRKLVKADENNKMIKFYLAISEMELCNLHKSEELLLDLTKSKKHIFYEQSSWYLALLYLKQDNIEKAKEVFEVIIEEEMVKKTASERILKSLE